MHFTKNRIYIILLLLIATSLYFSFLLNPSWSYDFETKIGQVNVHHNQPLQDGTDHLIFSAYTMLQSSEIFDAEMEIDLCLPDDPIYPALHPKKGGLAFAFLNFCVIYSVTPHFQDNRASYLTGETKELREVDLTWLLAHEFTHNLQFNHDLSFMKKINFWQQEGYAEYIGRAYVNDGRLYEKVIAFKNLEANPSNEFFILPNGTEQSVEYFGFALMIQYLLEEKGLAYEAINKVDQNYDDVQNEMNSWAHNFHSNN